MTASPALPTIRSGPVDRHIALMRGINVGGKNILPMRELAAIFIEAGCRDVRTYIQSGNIVYRAAPSVAKRVATRVVKAVRQNFDIDSPVITRSAKELQAVLRHISLTEQQANNVRLHVAFMADKPSKRAVASLDPNRSPGDTFVVHGREIYLQFSRGAAKTKLTNNYFDKALGTVCTMRNWRTAQKLAELAGEGM